MANDSAANNPLPQWLQAVVDSEATQVDPEMALEILAAQNQQFQQQVCKVTDKVYCAVGYHGANTSMIVGDDGLIIVDTLMGPISAGNAYDAMRPFAEGKPVVAIIYTHGHGDHTGGASVFAGDGAPDVYAMETLGTETGADPAINPLMAKRGMRQFGRRLPPGQATHRGVAPAKTIDHDRAQGYLPPTVGVPQEGLAVEIAGVKLELIPGPGETDDALYVWLPEDKVLFAGDNFYSSFPNLYAIRGTGYRDVASWSSVAAAMAALDPEYLVPGHTMPIIGRDAAVGALSDYSAAIRSVYDQTVAGINAGKSPDLIAHEVQLPDVLKAKPYLVEYYGTVRNAVRAIYSGLLGWYDGNPTTLNPLAPRAKAKKMAELAGGTQALEQAMTDALDAGDYQWALTLADWVKWLEDADRQRAREAKIAALRGLGAQQYNAPNRNYYLSYAQELDSGQLSEVWF